MFCKNCGNQIPDGARFCPKCGYSYVNAQAPTGNTQVPPRMPQGYPGGGQVPPQYNPAPADGGDGGNKKLIIIIIIVIVVALAGALVGMKVMGVGPFATSQVSSDDDRDDRDDDDEKDDEDDEKDENDEDEKDEDKDEDSEDEESIEEDYDEESIEADYDEESLEDSDAAVQKKINKKKKKEKKAEKAAAETSDIEDMILLAQSRELTDDDLEGFSSFELSAIRNGIYAYRGYVFQTEEWNEYFSGYDWYDPDPDIEQGDLNKLENKNAGIIREYEEENFGGIYTF